MKTKNKMNLIAVSVAALSLGAMTGFGQVFDSVEALNNRAIAASPRAKEVFPWLTRTPSSRPAACCDAGEVKNELTAAKKNSAYAASPRVRELFPELGRAPAPPQEFTIAPLVGKNRAFDSSPRAKEQFPELRYSSPAPSKGGASKLMERGK